MGTRLWMRAAAACAALGGLLQFGVLASRLARTNMVDGAGVDLYNVWLVVLRLRWGEVAPWVCFLLALLLLGLGIGRHLGWLGGLGLAAAALGALLALSATADIVKTLTPCFPGNRFIRQMICLAMLPDASLGRYLIPAVGGALLLSLGLLLVGGALLRAGGRTRGAGVPPLLLGLLALDTPFVLAQAARYGPGLFPNDALTSALGVAWGLAWLAWAAALWLGAGREPRGAPHVLPAHPAALA